MRYIFFYRVFLGGFERIGNVEKKIFFKVLLGTVETRLTGHL